MSIEKSPEFLKALVEICEMKYRGFLYGGDYIKAHSKGAIVGTMEEMQRQRKEIEDKSVNYRRHADQVRMEALAKVGHMGEISKNLRRRYGSDDMICPVCGEGSHGNKMNGKPYCFMNAKHRGLGSIPLMTPEKAKDWKPPVKPVKRGSYTFKELDGVVRK